MSIFKFRKNLTVKRRHTDNSVEEFSTQGMTRTEFAIDPENCMVESAKCIFLLSPDIEVKAGDVIADGENSFLLEKVSPVNNFDGVLLAYRATSTS